MAQYVTRHGANAGAVDVLAAVNLDIAGAAAVVTVPQGVSKIVEIWSSISASIVAVASAGVTVHIQLVGNGLREGTQELTVGTLREDTTSTAGAKILGPSILPVDIGVIPGNQIAINQAMSGVDPGTPQIDITLVFA